MYVVASDLRGRRAAEALVVRLAARDATRLITLTPDVQALANEWANYDERRGVALFVVVDDPPRLMRPGIEPLEWVEWDIDQEAREACGALVATESVRHDRISARTARQLALQTLADIEAARLRAAEAEAGRVFDAMKGE